MKHVHSTLSRRCRSLRRRKWKRRRKVLHKLQQKYVLRQQSRNHFHKRTRYFMFRQDWDVHVQQLCRGEFERRYRMSQERFEELLHMLGAVSGFFQPIDGTQ